MSVGLGEDENIFTWDLMIIGPPDTLYEGGFFNAKLEFPSDFPNAPPVMTFKTAIWHPNGAPLFLFFSCAPEGSTLSHVNILRFLSFFVSLLSNTVYEDGKVCISILHPPGEDRFNERVSSLFLFSDKNA